jgi:hypothetical protein
MAGGGRKHEATIQMSIFKKTINHIENNLTVPKEVFEAFSIIDAKTAV